MLALFGAACSADTIGPIPQGADESAAEGSAADAANPDETDEAAGAAAVDTSEDTADDAEAPAAEAAPGDAEDDASLGTAGAPDGLAFVDETEGPTESAVDYDAPDGLEDAAGMPQNGADLGLPELSDTFVGDGATLAADDGSLLVTCGTAGIDVESDGRPIDSVAVGSDGEVSTFLDLDASIVSVSGVIQTVWVDFDGKEQRFDC